MPMVRECQVRQIMTGNYTHGKRMSDDTDNDR